MEGDRIPATKRKFSEDSVSSSDDALPLSKRAKRLAAAKRSSSTYDRNTATSKRKFSEVSESSSDDDQALSKRTKRLSSTNDRNTATSNKRKSSEDSVTSSDDDLRQSKRLVPERASSTNIYDIPEELLVEILCRLPCAKSVLRCKSVSKSWHSLTSDSSFIGRFLWLKRHNQTLIPGTILNQKWGDELLNTDLFARFRSFRTEENERLEVLATWNDLVLCKSTLFKDDGQYYICNPRTMRSKDQLVTLPPIHQRGVVAVGFMCEPYYKEEEYRPADINTDQEEEERKVIKIDAEYKCKVVRILPPDGKGIRKLCFQFKIEVFCSEIGEWRESLVSCPRGFIYSKLASPLGFATNGMLYWNAKNGDVLGLGPLLINNKSTTTCSNSTTGNGDSGYQFHVIKLVDRQVHGNLRSSLYHLQAHRGRLQLVQTVGNEDRLGARLFIWELNIEELEEMAVQGGGELSQKHRNIYPIMDAVPCRKYTWLEYCGSDPNDLDTCYVSLQIHEDEPEVTYKCNIHTRECSKINRTFYGRELQIMLPWWPTPAPTIRSHTAETASEQVMQ